MKCGDVVSLRSGGRLMTVRSIDGVTPWVTCEWFTNDGECREKTFAVEQLRVEAEKKPPDTKDFRMCSKCHRKVKAGEKATTDKCDRVPDGDTTGKLCDGTFGPLNYEYQT